MCPIAFGSVRGGIGCEGGIPGEGGCVVLRTIGICAVEDSGFEGIVVGVLCVRSCSRSGGGCHSGGKGLSYDDGGGKGG